MKEKGMAGAETDRGARGERPSTSHSKPDAGASGRGATQAPLTAVQPELSYVRAGEGLELGSHAFLRPLPPCCARIASPYWARIIGTISNRRDSEVLVKVKATVFDAEGKVLGVHDDFMALDGGEKSEFDIRIATFYDNVLTYGLEAVEAVEP